MRIARRHDNLNYDVARLCHPSGRGGTGRNDAARSRASRSAVADRTVDTLQNYELTLKMALADNWKLAAEQAIFRIGNSNAEHLPGLWINYPSGNIIHNPCQNLHP